ncbi:RNA-directed DNA polymerase [Acinetobacter modestus]|uniref:Reverse transcriptase domain-containing protein n=1 Tax=Acinetobacter modestus TaxID=1776740 RepID=A0ABP2TUK4_9GAMM|nr:RNA-directed DNA polymerase [Acinetobacter modestus]ENU25783.1 hypothetical protein F992_03117 [Acinetobacter modestus]GGA30164.1 reverse transcriptase [Acinetobacter modestus]
MNLNDLIGRGYFPKELPPPFNSKKLALQIGTILPAWTTIYENNTLISSPNFILVQNSGETLQDFKKRKKVHKAQFISKYNTSKATTFSISKGKLSRRFLQIPNPKHFSLLAEKIVSRWSDYEAVFQLSTYSHSYPVLEPSLNKRSVSTFSKNVSEFRNSLLSTSIDKLIEVKVDISKFYPTIYTHSIAWALLGKEKAKQYFKQKDNLDILITSGDTDAELYKYAESVDIALRACQERQSIGIPIGPDTSHIIAEIIACRIDSIIKTRFNSLGLKACRYYDDYYLYVSSRDEADKILKGLQLILSEFQLEVNESKIKIHEFPFGFEDEFTHSLHSFDFKKSKQINNIKYYFSMLWMFAEKQPNKTDWIFKYALRVFEYSSIAIQRENWKVFEDLLIKTALVEPAILDILTRIFLTYNSYLDYDSKIKLKKLVNLTIKEHCSVHHNFEIAWALWISKTFNIEIEENCANQIIKTKDSVSNLILLDLINNTNLVQGNPNIDILRAELKDDILMTENWLLAYEAVKKGWLIPSDTNFIDNNLFFKILRDNDVEFYDTTKQLEIYEASTVPVEISTTVFSGFLASY